MLNNYGYGAGDGHGYGFGKGYGYAPMGVQLGRKHVERIPAEPIQEPEALGRFFQGLVRPNICENVRAGLAHIFGMV